MDDAGPSTGPLLNAIVTVLSVMHARMSKKDREIIRDLLIEIEDYQSRNPRYDESSVQALTSLRRRLEQEADFYVKAFQLPEQGDAG